VAAKAQVKPRTAPKRKPHAAVVYNPVKVDLRKLRRIVDKAEDANGWARTRWLATSESDAGQGVTTQAVERGAAVVLAAGGDGTVRAVAHALRGTGVPITLLPSGTGNLLARNLDINLTDNEAGVEAAFSGTERAIDLGIAVIRRPDDTREEHVFLVMAGLGLDAKMIAKTNPTLKKTVGWLAYVDAGVRALPELTPVRLRYRLDDQPERPLTAHTLIVGNCGSLPGGILLLPDAKPDDGILDIAALKPRGRFGWVRVWNKIAWENGVLRKSAAGRKIIDLTADVRDVAYFRGARLRVELERPEEFQLDGDEFGKVVAIECSTDPGALVVRVPA
jgi:diacylglycerol kinase family enzyme